MADSGNATNATATGDEGASWFQFPGWRWAFFNIIIWLMPLLLAFGMLFNILCFVTILRSRKTFPKISRRNMLIITFSDILVLAIGGVNCYHTYWNRTMGYSIIPSLLNRQGESPAACYITNFVYKYFLNGTPYFHVGLTIERVLAVVMPLKVKRIMTVRNHSIMLVVLFLLGCVDSALWSAEQVYDGGECQGGEGPLTKLLDKLQYNIEFYVSKVGLFFSLLTGCIVVAVALKLQARNMARLSSGRASSKRNKMTGACAVMVAMNVVFFLTHAPRAAFSVYEGYTKLLGVKVLADGEMDLVYRIAEGVMFLHSIVDPFAYFMGRGFRSAFTRNLGDIIGMVVCCARRRLPWMTTGMATAGTSVTGSATVGKL